MKTLHYFAALLVFSVLGTTAVAAQGNLEITITGGEESAQSIAIVPFRGLESVPTDVAKIIESDLARTGLFKPLPRDAMLEKPYDITQVNYSNWRSVNADTLVIGQLTQGVAGTIGARFFLLDTVRGQRLLGYDMPTVSPTQVRYLAHQMANLIYKKLTGIPGAFDTRIAYVSATGLGYTRKFELVVADADGESPRVVAVSREPLMSPSWSPDRKHLAYVGYERGRSSVYIQNLQTGKVTKLVSEKGINGSPAWSPDGRSMALTLSFETNPDIYIVDVATGNRRRITDHYGIDTEASWAPDGQSLVFTSDRGGRPQIYKVSALGGTPERLTFEGSQNLRASYSPDGKKLCLVNAEGGSYRIGIMDVASRDLSIITEGRLDESPQFAPNGSVIIYATQGRGRAELATVSLDGRVKTRLRQTGDVREPAWSPMASR